LKELKSQYNITVAFERAKHLLEENDGAGNTFKGDGQTSAYRDRRRRRHDHDLLDHHGADRRANQKHGEPSLLHAPFVLGLIMGGAVIYWFTGAVNASRHYRRLPRRLSSLRPTSNWMASKKPPSPTARKSSRFVPSTRRKGMFNIFMGVFFSTLAFAFLEPFFFIGYLISIAIFGLYQAIFMANAGGAWDNAKKVVEVDMKQKGTPLHDATVIGDTVGDPFKDTSSVAMNPVIKFTTLFGLLAVELAVSLTNKNGATLGYILAAVFFLISVFFVARSFHGMRIGSRQVVGWHAHLARDFTAGRPCHFF
jgi:K(+)-stimulated pyrophosphate-energized sodium pump